MNNVSYESPEVSLPRDGGEVLNLKEFRPKNVVLFHSTCILLTRDEQINDDPL